MKKAIVVAASENNAIGKDNQLMWHLPADMRFFKEITIGHPIIMGRKTYQALGKPLPGRLNILISRQGGFIIEIANVLRTCKSIDEAFKIAEETEQEVCSIIGGGEIYRQTWHRADILYLTRIHAQYDGDTFIPPLDDYWTLTEERFHDIDDKHAVPFTFQTYYKTI